MLALAERRLAGVVAAGAALLTMIAVPLDAGQTCVISAAGRPDYAASPAVRGGGDLPPSWSGGGEAMRCGRSFGADCSAARHARAAFASPGSLGAVTSKLSGSIAASVWPQRAGPRLRERRLAAAVFQRSARSPRAAGEITREGVPARLPAACDLAVRDVPLVR